MHDRVDVDAPRPVDELDGRVSGVFELAPAAADGGELDGLVLRAIFVQEPLRAAEQVLLDDVAIAPGYLGVARNLVSPQVHGFVTNNVNIHRSRYMSLDRGIRTV